MSSVQRFLRQRVVGTTTYSLPTAPQGQDFNDLFYVLQTDSDNYVGNYPPGNMITLADLATASQTPLLPDITGCVLRDMGKTVKARVTDGTDVGSTAGFFRAVQIIQPLNIVPQTFGVGGGAATSFMAGSGRPQSLGPGNTGDKGYGTFYIPIVVDGVIASQATTNTPLVPVNVSMIAGEVM
jgi:hypothetical protein